MTKVVAPACVLSTLAVVLALYALFHTIPFYGDRPVLWSLVAAGVTCALVSTVLHFTKGDTKSIGIIAAAFVLIAVLLGVGLPIFGFHDLGPPLGTLLLLAGLAAFVTYLTALYYKWRGKRPPASLAN